MHKNAACLRKWNVQTSKEIAHSKGEENITGKVPQTFQIVQTKSGNPDTLQKSLRHLEDIRTVKCGRGNQREKTRKMYTKWYLPWLIVYSVGPTSTSSPILCILGLPVIMAATTQSTILFLLLMAGTGRAAQMFPLLFSLLEDSFVRKCTKPAQQFPIYLKDKETKIKIKKRECSTWVLQNIGTGS